MTIGMSVEVKFMCQCEGQTCNLSNFLYSFIPHCHTTPNESLKTFNLSF